MNFRYHSAQTRDQGGQPCRSSRTAFTLIELLTVIAIIAVLASITVGLTAAARNARVNSRGQSELRLIQTAIEAYKADRNAYPPDHIVSEPGKKVEVDPLVNQLYYELRGMDVVNNVFRPKGQQDTITPDAVRTAFGRGGFLNASTDASEPAKTYLDPKASMVRRVAVRGVNVDLLVSPFDWPTSAKAAPLAIYGEKSRSNPWRYVSTSPTNNTGGFDLWVEVMVGKEKRFFKNW